MTFSAEILEPEYWPFASASVTGSVACGPVKSPIHVAVDTSADIPAGSFTIRVVGTILDSKGEVNCQVFDTTVIRVVRLRTLSVTFGGPDRRDISKDDGTGVYAAPHWKDNSVPPNDNNDDVGDHNFPVLYPRNKRMHVSAVFQVEPPDALGTSAEVRGVASASGATYVFQATGSLSGGTLAVTDVPADRLLADRLDYFDPLTIQWTITGGGAPPLICDVPITKHRIYVTLGPGIAGTTLHETIVHLGCTNAGGLSQQDAAIAAIWNEFTDRDVRRKPKDGLNVVDGAQLSYYGDWSCINTTTAALLEKGDGQCGAWAKFFIDILGAQGIDHTNEYIVFYHVSLGPLSPYGFAVKNWTFAQGAGISGDPQYPYLNVPNSPFITSQYNWRFAQVNDVPGMAGQATTNPASLFNNHQVVRFGTPPVYYDPSYGVTYTSLAEIDTNAIDGYFKFVANHPVDEATVGVDLNGNGNITDIGVQVPSFLMLKSPAQNQLSEVANEYP